MNLAEFKVWARRRLGEDGECTVKVELTDNQILQSLEDAKDWWNLAKGLFRETYIDLVGGNGEYDLTSIRPRVDTVVTIIPPRPKWEIDFRDLYPGFLDVNLVPYNMGSMFGTESPQTGIVQIRQVFESTERVLGADFSWEMYSENVDETTRIRTLRVFPPTTEGRMLIVYRVDPADINLFNYQSRDLNIVRDYALALCKEMLGRIRSKYSAVPTAGGEKQLDGEALLAEAQSDKDRLEERVLQDDGPVMPVVG